MRTRWFSLIGVVCSLVMLAACTAGPQTGNGAETGGAVTGGEVTGGEVTAVVSTSEPGVVNSGGAISGGAVTGGTPDGVIVATPGQEYTITLDNDQQTLRLKAGQRFLLQLGEGYNWTLALTDESVAARVKNYTVVRGAQGVYETLKPGTTTLTADGEPGCRQSKPACMMPNRRFTLTIEVIE